MTSTGGPNHPVNTEEHENLNFYFNTNFTKLSVSI